MKGSPGLFGESDEDIAAGIEADVQALLRSPKRLSRYDDPRTSREAARHIDRHLTRLHGEVAAIVRANPGQTSSELSELSGDRDVRRIGRRLPELEELGRVRRGEARACQITGRSASTWYPTDGKEIR